MNKILKVIDIELFDNTGQKILNSRKFKISLSQKYLKYEMDFDTLEPSEILGEVNISRMETTYIDRDSVTAVFSSISNNNTEGEESLDYGVMIIGVTSKDGDDQRFLFIDHKKAKELLEILVDWKWN